MVFDSYLYTCTQNDLEDMRYFDEGNVNVNMARYDIVNVSIGYCIVHLDDMKYNLGMRVLHKGCKLVNRSHQHPLKWLFLRNIFEIFLEKKFNFIFFNI